jgi:hypothetical protein
MFSGLGDEQGGHRHVDIGAVQIERIAGGHDQTNHGLGRAGAFHLLEQAGQGGFGRRGAQHQQQFFLQVADQLEDVEAVGPGDQAQNPDHEDRGGDVEGGDQAARLAIEPMPYLPMVKAKAPKAPMGAAFIRMAPV